ncbi:F-box associated domain containing protein [Tanacetum coccineum]|uniref:F-box associated domain containing protein n=1 Tax=Tanacetum coccineum TaxID=301880 RepID=A0ABQ4ZSI1_9ASTR
MADDFTRVVGSCNGLLCISHYRGLSIYNPSTRRCNMLYGGFSDENPYQVGYGFGYAKSTDDYKVVGVSNADDIVKTVRDDIVFLKGCVQLLDTVPNLWKIVSFDLETKTYDEVLHPEYDEGNKTLDLGVLGGWLCVVCNYDINHVADVWVMKDYAEKDSWTKLVSITYPDPLIQPFFDIQESWARFWKALWMSSDDKILLRFRFHVVLYDSKNISFTFLEARHFAL